MHSPDSQPSALKRFLASRWMLYGPVLLFLGLIASSAWYAKRQYDQMESAKAEAAKPQPLPDPIGQSWPGKLRAQNTVRIPAPIDGTLESIEVQDGEEVFEGQLLGRIVNSSLEAHKTRAEEDLERARTRLSELDSQVLAARLEANRASAELTRVRSEHEAALRLVERQRKLFQEGAAARKTYEKVEADYQKLATELKGTEDAAQTAEARLKALQAGAEEARQKLNEVTEDLEEAEAEQLTGEVKATVTGLLIAHRRGAGDEVTRDIEDLFEIAADLGAMEVVVEIPPDLAGRLQVGGGALVLVAEAGEAPLNGTIRELRSDAAVVEFISPTPAIRPGATGRARFVEAPVGIR